MGPFEIKRGQNGVLISEVGLVGPGLGLPTPPPTHSKIYGDAPAIMGITRT